MYVLDPIRALRIADWRRCEPAFFGLIESALPHMGTD
jgi:hypothetical protein